jgi:hypothetical protein
MAPGGGGRKEKMIFTLVLFQVCAEEAICRDCGESQVVTPYGHNNNQTYVVKGINHLCMWNIAPQWPGAAR